MINLTSNRKILFLDSNVILGAAQSQLIRDIRETSISIGKLLKTSKYHDYSLEVITKGIIKPKDFELFTTYSVKREVQKIISEPEIIDKKIIIKLQLDDEISKLSEQDRKLFLSFIYENFLLKFPVSVNDILNRLSSKSVDELACKDIVDELFDHVFHPVFKRLKVLKQHIELSGEAHKFQHELEEYETLRYVFNDFGPYPQNRDVKILAEAIFCHRLFISELKTPPEFHFVSNDRLFRANKITGGTQTYTGVIDAVNAHFAISLSTPKHILDLGIL